MAPVYACTSKPTGRYMVKSTMFGPRIYVEVIEHKWDTNSADPGWDSPPMFRKMRNRDDPAVYMKQHVGEVVELKVIST